MRELMMNEFSGPIIWFLLGLAGAVGLIALVSPRWFALLSARSNRWIDTAKAVAWLDKRIEVDAHLAPYTRVLGGAALLSVAVLAYFVTNWQ